MNSENILIWLPSPMGDAVMCTAALRSIRNLFNRQRIYFLGNNVVRNILSPGDFYDEWIEYSRMNPLAMAAKLKKYNFSQAILFKNSFSSALAVFLAGIKTRIGYARQGRGFMLTDKLIPQKSADGAFKPEPMIDYYLAIASWLGAETDNRTMELSLKNSDIETARNKLNLANDSAGPIVVLVPGAAGGASKCWLKERFAQTADWLVENYKATVVVSVAPNAMERKIAEDICKTARHDLTSLANVDLTLGQLKAVLSLADLVICNDTGPRHIAVALKRKVISLIGPNDPVWSENNYENDVQIISQAQCAPCNKQKCERDEHICMQWITVEMVCKAAANVLGQL